MDMQKFSILITGASSGIGLHIAKRLAESGRYRVFAGVRKDADSRKIAGLGNSNLIPVSLDVQDPENIAQCALDLESENLYALINNAGIAVASPLEFFDVEVFKNQMDVNVTGLLRMTQACLPMLRKSKGRLINIGSISGKVTTPLLGGYSASKHAVEAMSDALRRELRGSGVQVSLVEPGIIDTPIWQRSKDYADSLMDKIPKHGQEIYRPMAEKLLKNIEVSLPKASSPEAVFSVVKHALESKSPKTRYLVGFDAKVAMALRLLPDTWLDSLVARNGSVRPK